MIGVQHPNDEAVPGPDLVGLLLHEQFPELAGHKVRPSTASGSSNWVFRVGDEFAVRLPRSESYTADLLTEARFLPRVAPHLDVPVPAVRFLAKPSALFPRPWTVVTWVPGETPAELSSPAQMRLATTLGRFMRRLHRVDTFGLDPGAKRWGYRAGEPVTAVIDTWADRVADDLDDLFDPSQVREAWRRIRDVPPASGPPCWVHTDLSAENLLASPTGDLVGVVDFGGLGIGTAPWTSSTPGACSTRRHVTSSAQSPGPTTARGCAQGRGRSSDPGCSPSAAIEIPCPPEQPTSPGWSKSLPRKSASPFDSHPKRPANRTAYGASAPQRPWSNRRRPIAVSGSASGLSVLRTRSDGVRGLGVQRRLP